MWVRAYVSVRVCVRCPNATSSTHTECSIRNKSGRAQDIFIALIKHAIAFITIIHKLP